MKLWICLKMGYAPETTLWENDESPIQYLGKILSDTPEMFGLKLGLNRAVSHHSPYENNHLVGGLEHFSIYIGNSHRN